MTAGPPHRNFWLELPDGARPLERYLLSAARKRQKGFDELAFHASHFDTANAARRLVKKLYLYTNNHFSAKSVANAALIKQQLGESIKGEYPAEFLERYPELAGVAKSQSTTSAIPVTRARTSSK